MAAFGGGNIQRHASWLSDSDVAADVVSTVSRSSRSGDEGLCAWVDAREPRRFLVSYDVESASRATAARECLAQVVQVAQDEPRIGLLEEVGATDDEGYLIVKAHDFEGLRNLAD